MDKNTSYYGTLIVSVSEADAAIPIKDAAVAVRFVGEDKTSIFSVLVTDESGRTAPIRVPTPSPELSLSPSPEERPYARVNVEVSAFGYFTTVNMNVPVFSGITSVQGFNMIAFPDNVDGAYIAPNVIVFDSESAERGD